MIKRHNNNNFLWKNSSLQFSWTILAVASHFCKSSNWKHGRFWISAPISRQHFAAIKVYYFPRWNSRIISYQCQCWAEAEASDFCFLSTQINPIIQRGGHRRKSRRRSRSSASSLYNKISNGVAMKFNYVSLLVIASILAGMGLATNSTTEVISSMLLSPIMGPVLGMS